MNTTLRAAVALALTVGGLSPALAAPPASGGAAAAAHGHRSATGVGVITEIDAKGEVLTLRHEPIAALGWPTMVMPFHLASPGLLTGLKVGQKVAFDTREAEGLPEITAIRKR